MLSQIQKTAEKLSKAQVCRGDRVAILSENSVEYAVFVMSCCQVGAVVVPVSVRYPESKINSVLADIGCEKIFVSVNYSQTNLSSQKYLLDDFVKLNQSEITVANFNDMNLDMEKDASIIFTSASTGQPKAVLHTIGNHYFNALGAGRNIPFAKGDRWLMSLPMYHISGFSILMRAALNEGTIVFPVPDDPIDKTLLATDITHLSLVPAQLAGLLTKPGCIDRLKSIKAILVGGGPVPSALIEKATAEDLPIYATYGSTETASQITTTKAGDLQRFKNSCGHVLECRKLKIAPDGEIIVKGEVLFKGYVLGDSTTSAVDNDGFFHTGDIGCLDESGNLYVTGRKDLMFISGGENIFPEEIERAIKNIEGVEQVVVVPVTNVAMGRRPAAFIKMQTSEKPDADFIVNRLRERLEGFKVPVAFFEWPQTENFPIKPDRIALQNHANKLLS